MNPNTGVSDKCATYLNIYLTLEPALNVPEPIREKLECDEEEDIVEICERNLCYVYKQGQKLSM